MENTPNMIQQKLPDTALVITTMGDLKAAFNSFWEEKGSSEISNLLANSKREKEQIFCDVSETALLLKCSEQTVYTLHSKGKLPASKPFGKKLFFEKDRIIDYIKAKRSVSAEELQQQADEMLLSANRKRA